MFVNSFFLLVFLIFLFFLVYHFYLLSKPQANTSSFLLLFFNNNPKAALLLSPLIYVLLIFGAIFLGYYSLIIIPLLLLLNFWLKSPYLVYVIHFLVLIRLLWFFSPFNEIFLMISPFRSFLCVFSLFSYVFFIYHHKVFLLWTSGFLRFAVVSTGDFSLIFAGGGIMHKSLDISTLAQEYTTYTPSIKKTTFLDYATSNCMSSRTNALVTRNTSLSVPYPIVNPQMFFDNISKHKYAAIAHEIKSYQKPPVIFKNNILPLWERVHFGEKTSITASEQTYFLKYGPHSRLFSNYEILAKAIGIDKLIVPHEDYYATIHMEHSENRHLVYPIKNLVELDWVAAQANEEFIAAKAGALKYFPGEQVTITRGRRSIDFVLTSESGKKLYLDVASLSDETINDMDFSVLGYKLKKLPNISGYENATKVLLYNYAWNSKTFLEASNLDSRILTVENTYIQKLFDLYNLKVDFLKPTPKPTGEFIFQQTPVVETYAIPREKAIKSIVYLKK